DHRRSCFFRLRLLPLQLHRTQKEVPRRIVRTRCRTHRCPAAPKSQLSRRALRQIPRCRQYSFLGRRQEHRLHRHSPARAKQLHSFARLQRFAALPQQNFSRHLLGSRHHRRHLLHVPRRYHHVFRRPPRLEGPRHRHGRNRRFAAVSRMGLLRLSPHCPHGPRVHHPRRRNGRRHRRPGCARLPSLPIGALRRRTLLSCYPRLPHSRSFAQQISRLFLLHRLSSRESFHLAPAQRRHQSRQICQSPPRSLLRFLPRRSRPRCVGLVCPLLALFLRTSRHCQRHAVAARQASQMGRTLRQRPSSFLRHLARLVRPLLPRLFFRRSVGLLQHESSQPLRRSQRSSPPPGRIRTTLQALRKNAHAAPAQPQIQHRNLSRRAQHHHARRRRHPESLRHGRRRDPSHAESSLRHHGRNSRRQP